MVYTINYFSHPLFSFFHLFFNNYIYIKINDCNIYIKIECTTKNMNKNTYTNKEKNKEKKYVKGKKKKYKKRKKYVKEKKRNKEK